MKRLEHLINEVRKSTDNTESNGVTDAELIEYFNDGVRFIQNLIFKHNPKADLFRASETYSPAASNEYTLPADIFAVNAIMQVEVNDYPLERIDEGNKNEMDGYWTEDGVLKISDNEYNQDVTVNYFQELPRFDKRWGKISVVNAGVSLVLEAGYDADASEVDDYITVVDKYGDPVLEGVYIDSFAGGATWTTASALTGVSAGHYVCMGKRSANRVTLPLACKTYLMDYVRQRVYTRNNYNDANKQVYFTDKQEADIVALFSNNSKDSVAIPVSDLTHLGF
jgi:hypothetical protein